MVIYLIAHGDRENGPDPIHTPEGLKQIWSLSLPDGIGMVVSGTGKRFLEILGIVLGKLPRAPVVKYSPFCGGPEGFQGEDDVILTDGRIINYHKEYIGVSNGPLDMWQFIASLPDRTLLCAGGALMIGLGLKAINKKGHLFELDPVNKTGKIIA